jgi:hypothetical protein
MLESRARIFWSLPFQAKTDFVGQTRKSNSFGCIAFVLEVAMSLKGLGVNGEFRDVM